MTLPNFLIIGAQKSGTTWLYSMLRQHPRVYMAPREIHYFNSNKNYAKGQNWYESHFREATSEHIAIGEKTPSYVKSDPECKFERAKRIHALVPDAKLIAVFRDPVERLISAVHHHRVRGRFDPHTSLDDILNREIDSPTQRLIRYGYYYEGLAPYYDFFPASQILVLIYETDIRDDCRKNETMTRLCNFLGIDARFQFAALTRRANRSDQVSLRSLRVAHRLRIPPRTRLWRGITVAMDKFLNEPADRTRASNVIRQRLYELYAPENRKLFALLGREIPEWTHADLQIPGADGS